VKADGAHFDSLIADLDAALRELFTWFERDPALWTRGRPGKWTAGQHADHVAISLTECTDAMERSARDLRAGTLSPPPRRWLLQHLWVGLVVGRGTMPRGIRTPKRFEATAQPDRVATLARLRREADRLRALGAGLSAAQLDRFWAPNPFRPQWRYTLPEIVRVNAVHVRHHARQVAELAAGK
jgi:DinB family protein